MIYIEKRVLVCSVVFRKYQGSFKWCIYHHDDRRCLLIHLTFSHSELKNWLPGQATRVWWSTGSSVNKHRQYECPGSSTISETRKWDTIDDRADFHSTDLKLLGHKGQVARRGNWGSIMLYYLISWTAHRVRRSVSCSLLWNQLPIVCSIWAILFPKQDCQ